MSFWAAPYQSVHVNSLARLAFILCSLILMYPSIRCVALYTCVYYIYSIVLFFSFSFFRRANTRINEHIDIIRCCNAPFNWQSGQINSRHRRERERKRERRIPIVMQRQRSARTNGVSNQRVDNYFLPLFLYYILYVGIHFFFISLLSLFFYCKQVRKEVKRFTRPVYHSIRYTTLSLSFIFVF